MELNKLQDIITHIAPLKFKTLEEETEAGGKGEGRGIIWPPLFLCVCSNFFSTQNLTKVLNLPPSI